MGKGLYRQQHTLELEKRMINRAFNSFFNTFDLLNNMMMIDQENVN